MTNRHLQVFVLGGAFVRPHEKCIRIVARRLGQQGRIPLMLRDTDPMGDDGQREVREYIVAPPLTRVPPERDLAGLVRHIDMEAPAACSGMGHRACVLRDKLRCGADPTPPSWGRPATGVGFGGPRSRANAGASARRMPRSSARCRLNAFSRSILRVSSVLKASGVELLTRMRARMAVANTGLAERKRSIMARRRVVLQGRWRRLETCGAATRRKVVSQYWATVGISSPRPCQSSICLGTKPSRRVVRCGEPSCS